MRNTLWKFPSIPRVPISGSTDGETPNGPKRQDIRHFRGALFHLPHTTEGEQLFAIDNRDPKSGANVIGRGIVGQLKGDLVIASPLYKQHFRLEDGSCLEYPEQSLRVWPVRLNGDAVEIGLFA
jgi:NAD(P)H-dependent nitrite reductase small subunit